MRSHAFFNGSDPALYRRPFAKAFTLVELLVVVGVIAVCVAILVPVVAKVRASASRTQCASNLRPLFAAFHQYAQQYDGTWPVVEYYADGVQAGATGVPNWRHKFWMEYLSPYLGQPVNIDGTQPGAYERLARSNNPLWGCPNFTLETATKMALSGTGYGMNAYFGLEVGQRGVGRTSTGSWAYAAFSSRLPDHNGVFPKVSQWTHPEARCLLADAIGISATSAGWPWWDQTGQSRNAPMPSEPYIPDFTPDFNRHGRAGGRADGDKIRTINVLYCDGHVDTVSARGAAAALLMRPDLAK
jgi:prepilin-type N-terminal cleavage/methylation domain-containing protein/prepilin-type processing-associated H-X9-DG protein